MELIGSFILSVLQTLVAEININNF